MKAGCSARQEIKHLGVRERTPAIHQALQFVREYWARVLGLSALILIPCFWHREIIAGDLGSHLYNTWLAQLIEHGQIAGLAIVRQWDNVLFDLILSGLAKFVSLHIAERIAVSFSVLVFFWGTFTFASAAARRVNWIVVPALATVTYGWTFEMGFFNYYLSLGLSCFALALFWRGVGWERLISLAFVPFVYMAHPIGVLWLVGMAVYLEIAEKLSTPGQIGLALASICGIVAVHFYLLRHFRISSMPLPFFLYNGADQMALFGTRYWALCVLFMFALIVVLAMDTRRRRREPNFGRRYGILLQIYAITETGIFLAPDKIWLSKYSAPAEMISARLTTISAILICCLLMSVRPKSWHWAAFGTIAVAFFALLYRDTSGIEQMEDQVRQLVHTLPPGQRILATLPTARHTRVFISHIVDGACVGYCFNYANYEPPSGQFRIRVVTPNPYEVADEDSVIKIREGIYTVRPQDLPAYEIYACNTTRLHVCMRSLAAGEKNDEFAGPSPVRVSNLQPTSAR